MLFIGSDNGRLYALSPATGREIWNRSFGEFATVQSTPCVSDGVVYVGSQNQGDSGLFALNASDGSTIWSIPDDMGIAASPALFGGTVYSCSLNGTVLAANASTGRILWMTMRDGDLWASPSLDGECLYGGTIRGEAFALWMSNGTVRWNLTYPAGWTVYSTACVSKGTVYTGFSDYGLTAGDLLALDASTGAVKWKYRCEGIYSTPAAAGDALYAHVWNKTAKGSFLVALPASDPDGDGVISEGELLWSFQTMDFEGGSSPLVSDNLVVVGSSDGNLYAVNRSTGALAWTSAVGGKLVGSPGLFERKIYASSIGGRVVCVGSSSELPGLRVEASLERRSLPSGMVMRINILVTDEAGNPAEGAFVKFGVTAGNLSQMGASTFPDGSQSVKYLAPPAKRDMTVTLTLSASKGGYATGGSSVDFNVTVYRSAYSGVVSSSSFNFAKYSPYLAAIVALAAANAAVFALLARKGWLGRRRRASGGEPA
jgi:outer membrane protein assembly factor BamB